MSSLGRRRSVEPSLAPGSSFRRIFRCCLAGLGITVLWGLAAVPVAAAPTSLPASPRLVFEASPDLEKELPRLKAAGEAVLARAVRRVGLKDPGPPIRVILAPETSPLAAGIPPWVSGYAYGNVGVVVLLVDRVPRYPSGSLAEVLRHEVAHVLIDRAADGAPVPRWFHEGFAMALDGRWGLGDSTRFAYALLRLRKVPMEEVGSWFGGDAAQVAAAYSISGSLVRDLQQKHGADLPARILRRLREGEAFDSAFEAEAGRSLAVAQSELWRRRDFWWRWLPFASDPTILWIAITLLALAAIWRRRQMNLRLHALWAQEESLAATAEQRARERWLEGHRRVGPERPRQEPKEWVN